MTINSRKKLLIVQVAGLGFEFLRQRRGTTWEGLTFKPTDTVFPAVTGTVQASFRTASFPSAHGMVANGLWDPAYRKVRFWEQSSSLVAGPRIWTGFRQAGHRVAMLFWQQSLGEEVDYLVSPAPIHKHHGGMIQDCYSQPPDLYPRMCRHLGRAFNLFHYWGPFASPRSSQWIAEATAWLLASSEAPDLCMTYLPALDYGLQRFGTDAPQAHKALDTALDQIHLLKTAADNHGYDVLLFGDYAIRNCFKAAYPNRALLDADLMAVRNVRGRLYPDFHTSAAFAVVDHEIAHVYIRDASKIDSVKRLFSNMPGIGRVLDDAQLRDLRIDHKNTGEFVLVAEDGYWFAYPWWKSSGEEPDYARHVDIHNKPGYDPCELFFGWPPGAISRNTARIRGSHGKHGSGRQVAWASTFLDGDVESLVRLAAETRNWMESSL